MKTPVDLRERLRKQWYNADHREQRLLSPTHWPLRLAIGKPAPALVRDEPHRLRDHLDLWREVKEGTVEWAPVNYRHLSDAVELPHFWVLNSPSEWIAACQDRAIRDEYTHLETIVGAVSDVFHPLVVRQRQQVLSRSADTVIQIARVAEQLSPGCARQMPLRSLSLAGSDSKFFERHRALVRLFLEQRYGSEVIDRGLEGFLDALDENDHWLLVAPLEEGLLPFRQQRVRSKELMKCALPGTRVVLVENEKSLYQLPKLEDTVAILGSGMNLSWLSASWLREKSVIYWGDIDTWGLLMLARAREHLPRIKPMLMTRKIFDKYAPRYAVEEPQIAGGTVPEHLSSEEGAMYCYLPECAKGRLEQEFLPKQVVYSALRDMQ